MVPLARLELALREETDFESVASTSSATGAFRGKIRRRKLTIHAPAVNGSVRSTG